MAAWSSAVSLVYVNIYNVHDWKSHTQEIETLKN